MRKTVLSLSMDPQLFLIHCVLTDWDVLIEIQMSQQAQLPGIKFQHVRGHQDRTTAYNRLDQMLDQLNVDADSKAGRFQDEHGSYRTQAFLMSHTRAQLLRPQGTITSHFANRESHPLHSISNSPQSISTPEESMVARHLSVSSLGRSWFRLEKNEQTPHPLYQISIRYSAYHSTSQQIRSRETNMSNVSVRSGEP